VAGHGAQGDPGRHLEGALHQVQEAGLLEGLPVPGEVRGALPQEAAPCVLQVPGLEEVPGPGEGGDGPAAGVQARGAPGVVEVQVGEDDGVHLGGIHAFAAEPLLQGPPGAHGEALPEGVALLVAVARVHEDGPPPAPQQEAVGVQEDAVLVVGGAVALPHDPGHGAEHAPAVQAEGTRADDADVPVAQPHRRT